MGRNVSPEEKVEAVKEYLVGKGSCKSIAEKYGVAETPFRRWINKYLAFGESAFVRTGHNISYSAAFKEKVVKGYLCGEDSYEGLARKYKIPSHDTIRDWVLKYNGHKELNTSGRGGNEIVTKGRKTTIDERIEIVQYCIAHGHNYIETAKRYHISYQQARSYTVKYEEKGIEGLQDKRGKRKSEDEMSELEKLRAENRVLQAQKEHAEMEVNFLKKLAEIERRRG